MKILAETDPIQYLTIAGAAAPHEVREAMQDAMIELGMTREDLQEIIDKAERNKPTKPIPPLP
jgi:ABC-type phosphate/phosphonate transport system substrate-binding protein